MAGGAAFAMLPAAHDLTPAPHRPPPQREGPAGFAGSTRPTGAIRLSPSRVPARAGGAAGAEGVRGVIGGPGSRLDGGTRAFMEARLGQDLGDVRVHTGPEAAASAADLGASAYSVGRHVVFGAGSYQPGSEPGRRLIAHELAHTVQAAGGPATPAGPLAVGDRHDPAEHEAEQFAGAAVAPVRPGAEKRDQPGAAGAAGRVSPPPGGQLRPSAGVGAGAAVIHRSPDPPAPGAAAPAPAPAPAPALPNPSLAAVPPLGAADSLAADASPFLASAIASATVDGFPTGGSDLSPAQSAVLRTSAQRIVILLDKYPASTVSVVGHTDTVGTEASNVTLGRARAESAKAALVQMGVPAAAITTSSAGEGAPQAVHTADETPSARNRRVEVHFVPSTLGNGAGTSMLPAAPPPVPGGFGTAPPLSLPGLGLGPGASSALPGTGPLAPTQAASPNVFQHIPPSTVQQIQSLGDAITAAGSAVDRDKLVRQLRDILARITPFVPDKQVADALDDAIKAGVPEGIKAGIKALLQAITGQSGTDMPANPSHTLPLPGAPGEHMIPGPTLTSPFDKPPPLPPRTSYGYRNGPKATYQPGEQMTFTLLTPDTVPVGSRLVVIAAADESKDNPDHLAQVTIETKGPKTIELTAPSTPGRYALRVNVGFGWDAVSIQEFEVKSPPAAAPAPPPAPAPAH